MLKHALGDNDSIDRETFTHTVVDETNPPAEIAYKFRNLKKAETISPAMSQTLFLAGMTCFKDEDITHQISMLKQVTKLLGRAKPVKEGMRVSGFALKSDAHAAAMLILSKLQKDLQKRTWLT